MLSITLYFSGYTDQSWCYVGGRYTGHEYQEVTIIGAIIDVTSTM